MGSTVGYRTASWLNMGFTPNYTIKLISYLFREFVGSIKLIWTRQVKPIKCARTDYKRIYNDESPQLDNSLSRRVLANGLIKANTALRIIT